MTKKLADPYFVPGLDFSEDFPVEAYVKIQGSLESSLETLQSAFDLIVSMGSTATASAYIERIRIIIEKSMNTLYLEQNDEGN